MSSMFKCPLVVTSNLVLDGNLESMPWICMFFHLLYMWKFFWIDNYNSYTNVKAVYVNLGLKYSGSLWSVIWGVVTYVKRMWCNRCTYSWMFVYIRWLEIATETTIFNPLRASKYRCALIMTSITPDREFYVVGSFTRWVWYITQLNPFTKSSCSPLCAVASVQL